MTVVVPKQKAEENKVREAQLGFHHPKALNINVLWYIKYLKVPPELNINSPPQMLSQGWAVGPIQRPPQCEGQKDQREGGRPNSWAQAFITYLKNLILSSKVFFAFKQKEAEPSCRKCFFYRKLSPSPYQVGDKRSIYQVNSFSASFFSNGKSVGNVWHRIDLIMCPRLVCGT